MKKLFLLAAAAISMTAGAQVNIQLHYDLGRNLYPNDQSNRGYFTTTVEMFKADRLGSTYFFVDMDYCGNYRRYDANGCAIDDGSSNRGNIAAYWEVSRDFTFAKVKNTNHSFSAHIEYDGGLSQAAGPFQQAILVGPAWSWHNADFKKTFTLQVMYKQFLNSNDRNDFSSSGHDAHPSFQITPIWNITFANDLCTFSGFADLWYGWGSNFKGAIDANGRFTTEQQKGLVFLTEPQFWFHIVNKGKTSNRLSVGTEVEISNNFIYGTRYINGIPYGSNTNKTFFVNPTIALKWDI